MAYFRYLTLSITLIFSATVFANNLKIAIIIEPPFSQLKDDTLIGYNVEIANILADSINLPPIFIQCPFARCLSILEKGEADLMIGLLKLPVREKNLIFIEPPLSVQHEPLRLYTLAKRNITINNFSDLDKLIVGKLRGAIYFPLFDDNNSIKNIEFTSREQLVNMLLKGRIDTFFDREESIRPLLTKQEYQNEIALSQYQYSKPVKNYIAISKHSHITDYAQKISEKLSMLITSGKINSIEEKFLPNH